MGCIVVLVLGFSGAGRAAAPPEAAAETASARELDRVQGVSPPERRAALAAQGLGVERWLPELETASAAASRPEAAADPEVFRKLLAGARLARLAGAVEAVDALRRLATTPGMPEPVAYEAMVSLSDLGGSRDLLLALADAPDPALARLAILAVGVSTDPAVAERLEQVRRKRGLVSEINAALQFVDLYRHDRRLYESLPGPAQRLRFLEERLRRAYNPVNGETQTSDPISAGHPVSRWAMEEWQRLTAAQPTAAAAFIAKVAYPTPETSAGYRRFLADLADPAARPGARGDG
jgi:hypothetical protein